MRTSIASALTFGSIVSAAAFAASNDTSNTAGDYCHKDDFPGLSANMSLTADSLTFSLGGDMPVTANTTLHLVLRYEGDDVFHQVLDPCLTTDLPELCPSMAGPLQSRSEIAFPPELSFEEAQPDAARLYIEAASSDGKISRGCFEQILAEDTATETGGHNSTSSANGGSAGGSQDQNATGSAGSDQPNESDQNDTATDEASGETPESSGNLASPRWEQAG